MTRARARTCVAVCAAPTVAALLAALLAACTATSTPLPAIDASPDTAQQSIGPYGGSLVSPDGVLTLTVPGGALSSAVLFTVGPTASPLPGAVGTVFEVGPSGTAFAIPATITFRYTAGELDGGATSDLAVATVVAGDWSPLSAGAVDPGASTVSGQTPHLSPFALVHTSAIPPADAAPAADGGPAADATVPGDATAADAADAGATGTSDAPSDAPPALDASALDAPAGDGAACTLESFPEGTCAIPTEPLCSDLPATAPASCADNPGGGGYTATCCPAADAGDAGGAGGAMGDAG